MAWRDAEFHVPQQEKHGIKIQQESWFVFLHSGWLIELLAGEQHIIGKVSSQRTHLKESHPKSKPGTHPMASLQTQTLFVPDFITRSLLHAMDHWVCSLQTHKNIWHQLFVKGVQVDAKLIFRAHGVFYTQKNCSFLNSTKTQMATCLQLELCVKRWVAFIPKQWKKEFWLKWAGRDAELHWSFQEWLQ